jgi:hypothetical protein
MVTSRKSKEFLAFDKAMGQILSVSKVELDRRMAEHRAKAALNPRKRGPKPKIKTDDDAPASDRVTADETAS